MSLIAENAEYIFEKLSIHIYLFFRLAFPLIIHGFQ